MNLPLDFQRTGARAAALLLVTVAGLVVATARDADAFCRTTTRDGEVDPTASSCGVPGLPIYWKTACVGYSMQRDGTRQLPNGVVERAIDQGFAAWHRVSCDGGAPSIEGKNLGMVECGQVEFRLDGANQHVVVFRDDGWPYADGEDTLALTTVTFDSHNGEILDFDTEINTHDHTFDASGRPPSGTHDLVSVITHESGHALGLAHTPDATAVMFDTYDEGGPLRREPRADDAAAICAVYRPDGTRAAANGKKVEAGPCDPTPLGGEASGCNAPKSVSSASGAGAPSPAAFGCAASPRAGVPLVVAIPFVAAVLLRRRRAQRVTSRTSRP